MAYLGIGILAGLVLGFALEWAIDWSALTGRRAKNNTKRSDVDRPSTG